MYLLAHVFSAVVSISSYFLVTSSSGPGSDAFSSGPKIRARHRQGDQRGTFYEDPQLGAVLFGKGVRRLGWAAGH